MIEIVSTALLCAGAFFFFSGTIGLVRFPDVYSRLHALAKADNVGLGCILFGLAFQEESVSAALKLLLIWPLILAANAAVTYAIANRADALGLTPWQREGE